MRLEIHPPLVVGATSVSDSATDLTRLVHARLWMGIDLAAWQVVRHGHLHVVRPSERPGEWRTVDLSRHPMRLWHGQCPGIELEHVARELTAWLEKKSLSFYRVPALAAVSEFGEGRDAFRRRTLGAIGGELRRRVEGTERKPRSLVPWRQRAEESDRALHLRRLASAVAGLSQDIEQVTVEDPVAAIVSAEVGVLLVGRGAQLASPAPRDLMLG